jgi:hypothetical protein
MTARERMESLIEIGLLLLFGIYLYETSRLFDVPAGM